MNRETLIQAIRSLVIDATSLDGKQVVVYQPPTKDGKGHRPTGPYIAVHVLTSKQAGSAGAETSNVENPDGTFQRDVISQHVASVSLSAYRAGAYDLLQAMRDVRTHDALLDRQIELLIAVRTIGDVVDSTVLRDRVQFEEQATCTMTVAYTRTSSDAVTVVETLQAKGEAGSDIADLDFTVTA